ncbi:hypothetical protein MMC14_006953 [Varicellaria rhodocarpa]|nr:hypothetical protein [Varicellaria rhodocarpa]
MLCKLCSTFSPCSHGEQNHSYLFAHHPDVRELIQSARKGCEFCRAIEHLIDSAFLKDSPEATNTMKTCSIREKKLVTFEEDASDYSDYELPEDFESDATDEDYEPSLADLLETSESQLPEERKNLFQSKAAKIQLFHVDGQSHYIEKDDGYHDRFVQSRNDEGVEANQWKTLMDSDTTSRKELQDVEKKKTTELLMDEANDQLWQQNTHVGRFKFHEVLQWILFQKPNMFGSQQIWLHIRNEFDEHAMDGPSGTYLSVDIGSIGWSLLSLSRGLRASFCFNGEYVNNVNELAVRCPELWKYKRRHLGRQDQKSGRYGQLDAELCIDSPPDWSLRLDEN